MKKLKKTSASTIAKIFAPLLRSLNIPMLGYFWGFYPGDNIYIQSNLELWDEFIVKNYALNKKIKFKQLRKEFLSKTQKDYKDITSELEEEYGKNLTNIPSELIKNKKEYLLNTFNLEKQRQNVLDNKSIQIITQTSIITAIIALIIPLLIDKIDFEKDPKRILFWIFVITLLSTLFFLLNSVIVSISNLRTTGYLRPMHTSILYHSKSTLKELHISQMVAYYQSTDINIKVNDQKANQVNKSYKRFKIGLMLFVLSAIIFVIHRCYYQYDNAQKVIIENSNIKSIEDNLNRTKKE